jgi:ribosomal protein L10
MSAVLAGLKSLKTISRQRKDILLSENLNLMTRNVVIFAQCNNLNSREMDELRANLAKSKIQIKFLKTSLLKFALKSFPQYSSSLLPVIGGPLMALSTDQEPGEAGKALLSAVKDKRNIHFLAGKIENKIWTHEGCAEILQTLGTKQEIQSKLLNILQTPSVSLHSCLSQVPASLASLINHISTTAEQKQKSEKSPDV